MFDWIVMLVGMVIGCLLLFLCFCVYALYRNEKTSQARRELISFVHENVDDWQDKSAWYHELVSYNKLMASRSKYIVICSVQSSRTV